MEFWNGKNVFVTGASGLLGSWIAERLVSLDANVTILLRDIVPTSKLLSGREMEKVSVVHGPLEDYFTVERALNEYEIDTVFHLGAQTIVGTANRSPLATFESNIKGTWTVMEAFRNSKLAQNLVFASSDKAYGTQKSLPYTEDTPLQGDNPYDVSKSCADLIVQSYAHTYGIRAGIARCGNLYGGGDLNFSRLVPGTIRSVLEKEAPVIRSDGTYIRDYLYVEDAADAYLLLAENLHRKEISGEPFNFSTGNKMTVLEVVQLILKKMDSALEPRILGEAKSEIKNQYLSGEKAKKMLGWEAKYPMDAGLERTIPWYEKYLQKSSG